LTFQYGQRHAVEIEAARRIAAHFQVARHVLVPIDLRVFGGSALTSDLPVPKGRSIEEMTREIPIPYLPPPHPIFLSFPLAPPATPFFFPLPWRWQRWLRPTMCLLA